MIAPVNADCNDLNRKYGSPGRIVFRPSKQGSPVCVLANQYGTCEIALLGAQTLSYRPTGNHPVLFMPEKAYEDCEVGTEIHGGIPVCWPWFAREGEEGSRAHGLARYFVWNVVASEYSEDVSEITLQLDSSEETRKLWNHDFSLKLKISVSMKLTLSLTAKNTGTESFFVTEGFHPYFRIRERDGVIVRGVDGLDFVYTKEPEIAPRTFTGDYTPKDGSMIFKATKYEYAVIDSGLKRAIAIVSRGNNCLVVWNPGELPAALQNVAKDDWNRFVCVEPCSTPRESGYELKPGESHDLLMAIQSVAEGGGVYAR